MSDIDHALTEDRVLGFSLSSRNVRGRLVRLGPVLNEVLAAHDYPPVIQKLVAEALVLAALLGAMLKEDQGQLTLQAQTESGVVSLLVADYKAGEVRGYAKFDAARLAEVGEEPTLFGLFGKGFLAITFDQATTGERYQGVVPLEGAGLGAAAEHYFAQSEQIPTQVRVGFAKQDGRCIAGGLLLQHLPEGEEGRERLHTKLDHPEWEHVAALGATMGADELADPSLLLESLLWRLFNEEDEVRVLAETVLRRGCRCTLEHIRGVLAEFPHEERLEMADENGIIGVDCAFCSTVFPVSVEELAG